VHEYYHLIFVPDSRKHFLIFISCLSASLTSSFQDYWLRNKLTKNSHSITIYLMFALHTHFVYPDRISIPALCRTHCIESIIEYSFLPLVVKRPIYDEDAQLLVSIWKKKKKKEREKEKKRNGRCSTYLVEPGQLVRPGICPDVALKVDVRALFDVLRIQCGAHLQTGNRRDCNQN